MKLQNNLFLKNLIKIFNFHFYLVFFLYIILITQLSVAVDLTIIGRMDSSIGLGQLAIGIIDQLKNEFDINIVSLDRIFFDGLPREIVEIIKRPNKSSGKVALYLDNIWHWNFPNRTDTVPLDSKVKIAYSMIEGSKIPEEYVDILNTKFDAVIVPDEFLINVYNNCGVRIPIFVIPHGVNLDRHLDKPLRQRPNKPFVFGFVSGFIPRKNYDLLIKAFAEEFKENNDVRLRLHGNYGNAQKFLDIIEKMNLTNIDLTFERINSQNLVNLIDSFDCFVSFSKGEGFSILPREAMALRIPCILSNNTAHTTICHTNLVRAVDSKIPLQAYYGHFKKNCGYNYDCTLEDAREALRDVYDNYNTYLNKVEQGREWSKQYRWENLKPYLLNIVKPKKTILGDSNIVTDEFLMTNSIELYEKYKNLF